MLDAHWSKTHVNVLPHLTCFAFVLCRPAVSQGQTVALSSVLPSQPFLVFQCFHHRHKPPRSFSSAHFLSRWSEWTTLYSSACFGRMLSALHSPVGGRRRRQSGGSSSGALASGWAPQVLLPLQKAVDDEPVKYGSGMNHYSMAM